ncbi:accessory Sec system protein translocase subunit SecY2 [Lactococcus cremoris]|uniref:accessory Sec system protein translocase subunit SecY2 n=1 Tax=Lactococcus lactis subsp. cremoris TaxID=1359 RepID=UPI0003ABA672|nr:accessory Sec system protein translocase subunit SecY2 [Lactococcus cremoris]AGV72755.1 accessory Sec system translocase SecY2 [Lactococcus cremoris subsp. cremoris KW2]
MDRQIYKRIALKRLSFSFLIAFIYILGSKILLPGINMNSLNLSSSLTFAMSMTGMSIDKLSLFSLGMGPWMSTIILWRVVGLIKFLNVESLTKQQTHIIRISISALVGGIQSYMIISQVKTLDGTISPLVLGMLLLTGAIVLVWLGDMNKQFGVGGPMVIILVAIIKTMISRVGQGVLLQTYSALTPIIILAFVALMLWASFLSFRFFQGERRLPFMHVMLDNRMIAESYYPLPVNPAGGLPFMYSFSVVLFPQYLISALLYFQPNNKILMGIYQNIKLTELPGVLLLILCVILLNYGFAYVNVDYKNIADNLQKNGDYFLNVYPGKNTEKFLFDIITRMATVSGIISILMVGAPMLCSIFWPGLSTWAYIIPTWMILLTLMDKIREEFLSIYNRNNYQTLF